MIVTASPKLQNGVVSDEDEEQIADKILHNGTLTVHGSLDLASSFSARDRRRNAVSLNYGLYFCLHLCCNVYFCA